MQYDILHDVPGRLRVHCRHLRLSPESSLELNRWLSEHDCLRSAALSARTGNLLILYSRTTSREAVLVILDDLRLFGVATVVRQEATPSPVIAACGREIVRAVTGPLFPGPVRRLFGWWRLAAGLCRLARLASRGEIAAFCSGAAKFAILALCGRSLPLRLLFIGIGAALQRTPTETPESAIPVETEVVLDSDYLLPAPGNAVDSAAM